MSTPVDRKSLLDPDGPSILELVPRVNPWSASLGILAGVLIVVGVITAWIGLGTVGNFNGTVLGQDQGFDQAVATSIVGGAVIFLGIGVGAVWLALGAVAWRRPA